MFLGRRTNPHPASPHEHPRICCGGLKPRRDRHAIRSDVGSRGLPTLVAQRDRRPPAVLAAAGVPPGTVFSEFELTAGFGVASRLMKPALRRLVPALFPALMLAGCGSPAPAATEGLPDTSGEEEVCTGPGCAFLWESISSPIVDFDPSAVVQVSDGSLVVVSRATSDDDNASRVFRYDFDSRAWSEGTAMPVGRYSFRAAAMPGNRVLAIANFNNGYGGLDETVNAWVYDVDADAWQEIVNGPGRRGNDEYLLALQNGNVLYTASQRWDLFDHETLAWTRSGTFSYDANHAVPTSDTVIELPSGELLVWATGDGSIVATFDSEFAFESKLGELPGAIHSDFEPFVGVFVPHLERIVLARHANFNAESATVTIDLDRLTLERATALPGKTIGPSSFYSAAALADTWMIAMQTDYDEDPTISLYDVAQDAWHELHGPFDHQNCRALRLRDGRVLFWRPASQRSSDVWIVDASSASASER